jgi:hypothetical protein
MAVEFPFPFELFVIGPLLIGGAALLAKLAPALIRSLRQRSYDQHAVGEMARWVLRVDPQAAREADASRRLIAGLHPGIRRGLSAWAVGWPQVCLDVTWSGRAASWEIRAPRQLAGMVEAAVSAAYPEAELRPVAINDPGRPAQWLALSGTAPDRAAGQRAASSITPALVELLARLRGRHAARWTIRLRPLTIANELASGSGVPSLGASVLAAMFNQPMPRPSAESRPITTEPSVRFAATVELEAWSVPPAVARPWLFDAMGLVGVLRATGWRVTGRIGGPPRSLIVDPDAIAELWSPPARSDEARAVEVLHSRLLPAPARLLAGERPIGRHGEDIVYLPSEVFLRHAAFIGGTGSGKSTQLVALAADDLAAGRGFTFLDPHGDAVERLLDAVPREHIERVHLIRLAEREAPRGFNFLELDGADPELVAVQFVDTLYDLYAKYSGPKQTHYLRMALLTLLAREPEADGPWTVVDLYQLLVNRDVRRRFTADLADEVLRDFWQHEWPLDSPRAREQSVEAVLNKLGGFIAYPTIRDIVGARHSTIRPRAVMDSGEVLLVDLSRVGRDHARLFGSMLIGRYYIDAMARQGTAAGSRTPHQLYVDEVHNFDTSSLRGILTETRKFALGLTLATQYVRRLQPELADALRSNVATLGLLQPAQTDVADLADLFAPLTARDLLNLPRFRMALRSQVDGERLVITPEVLRQPAALGSTDAVRRSSDARDARWRA